MFTISSRLCPTNNGLMKLLALKHLSSAITSLYQPQEVHTLRRASD